MSYAVVQHTSGSGSGTGLTTGKTLSGAPTAGNWIIASVCLQGGAAQTLCPIDTTKWFYVDEALDAGQVTLLGQNILRVLARKVVAGDTATMPAFCSSGSSFFAWTAMEISGGSGTWATDFHSARNNCNITSGVAAVTSPTDTTLVANTFALVFYAGYNETADGSISSGWTSDENTHNSSNYGSYGCAHQAFATAGTQFSAMFTRAGTSSNPKAIVTVLLTPSQPLTMHIKRHRSWQGGAAGTPGSIVMGGDPTNGNLLVTYLMWRDGSVAGPTVSGSWTNYANALNGSDPMVLGLYRYASSDTRTWPALCSAGSQVWTAETVELGGVTGTFATDHTSSKNGYQATGASMVTTSDSTTAANQIVTNGFANFAGTNAAPAVSGSTELLDGGWNSTTYGQWAQSRKYVASSGTAIQSTWTPADSTKPSAYIQDIWGSGSSSTETGTVVMALSGISYVDSGGIGEGGTGHLTLSGISYVGVAAREETSTGTLALSGASFAGAADVAQEFGTGALALSGISIKAQGFDLGLAGDGVRQFWTF